MQQLLCCVTPASKQHCFGPVPLAANIDWCLLAALFSANICLYWQEKHKNKVIAFSKPLPSLHRFQLEVAPGVSRGRVSAVSSPTGSPEMQPLWCPSPALPSGCILPLAFATQNSISREVQTMKADSHSSFWHHQAQSTTCFVETSFRQWVNEADLNTSSPTPTTCPHAIATSVKHHRKGWKTGAGTAQTATASKNSDIGLCADSALVLGHWLIWNRRYSFPITYKQQHKATNLYFMIWTL